MNKETIKEKRLYFLFSKLKNKKGNNTHFTLVVDTFLNNKNAFFNLFEISQKLQKIGISIKPEALEKTISEEAYNSYFEIAEDFRIDTPFKLKKIHFDNLNSYKNYYDKLDEYVISFLKTNNIESEKAENVKEILLTTLFKRNLSFLKQLITSKDANDLESILILDKNGHYSDEDCGIYNNLILTSGGEFNEILSVLLYKIFDFLQLHYNPNIDKTLNETYKNKVFYLDSSFIIRLFGFDNELREHRAIELINILNKIEGVKFIVHNSTITETQVNIKNIIDRVSKLLGHSEKALLKLDEISDKKSNIIELFLRLKKQGRIVNREDFILHFNNVLIKLKSIIGSKLVDRDDKKISFSQEKLDTLLSELSGTEKTNSRINHISKLLLFIEGRRESNVYNIYDIKYWLITTDGTTLKIDGKIRAINEDNSKSVCILPTELLRTISNRTEISANYIEVFKQFMVYSNAFNEQYSEDELATIDKVITLAEAANNEEYDVDYYISNLFDEINLEDLMNRLKKVGDKEKEDIELVKIFEETFGGVYREKYYALISSRNKLLRYLIKLLRFLIFFSIPIVILYLFLKLVLNPQFVFLDPLTYVNDGNWSKLEFIFTLIQLILVPSALFLNKKYGLKIENWIEQKIIPN
jgi:hypothetical protein